MPPRIYNPLATGFDHILTHTRDLWEELRDQRIFVTDHIDLIHNHTLAQNLLEKCSELEIIKQVARE